MAYAAAITFGSSSTVCEASFSTLSRVLTSNRRVFIVIFFIVCRNFAFYYAASMILSRLTRFASPSAYSLKLKPSGTKTEVCSLAQIPYALFSGSLEVLWFSTDVEAKWTLAKHFLAAFSETEIQAQLRSFMASKTSTLKYFFPSKARMRISARFFL